MSDDRLDVEYWKENQEEYSLIKDSSSFHRISLEKSLQNKEWNQSINELNKNNVRE